jgi:hypothetical protein
MPWYDFVNVRVCSMIANLMKMFEEKINNVNINKVFMNE